MSEKVWLTIIKACSTAFAMFIIWRLVSAAMAAGINGLMFFGGMAAIAGLGGYEIRWLIERVKAKATDKDSEK